MRHPASAAMAVLGTFLLAGCGAIHETLPPRSAMEQLLLSTAADRALLQLPTDWAEAKTVYVDSSRLECYDKPYVLQRVRKRLIEGGARMADEPLRADAVIEIASGALSVNKRDYLLGLPAIPIPVPGTQPFQTPELAILKAVFYRAKGKIIFVVTDARTGEPLSAPPDCLGESHCSFWWILFFGPNEWSDLPFKRQ